MENVFFVPGESLEMDGHGLQRAPATSFIVVNPTASDDPLQEVTNAM